MDVDKNFSDMVRGLRINMRDPQMIREHLESLLKEARSHKRQGRLKESFDHFYLHKVITEDEDFGVEIPQTQEIWEVFQGYADKLESEKDLHKLWKAYDNFLSVLKSEPKMAAQVLSDKGLRCFKEGLFDDLVPCFEKSLRLDKYNLKIRDTKERIYSLMMDRWHFPMINDFQRNDLFRAAIVEQIESLGHKTKGQEVVNIIDIGAGTGLLSLYCSKAQYPTKVTACEASLPMANVMKNVLLKNPNPNICPFPHFSMDLPKTNATDLIITETFDAGLLGEHVLASLYHAHKNLLRPGGHIIPCRAQVFICPIQCPQIIDSYRFSKAKCGLLDMLNLSLNSDTDPYESENLTKVKGGFKFLSKPEKLIDLNFENLTQIQEYLESGRDFQRRFRTNVEGEVHAIAMWFDLVLKDGDEDDPPVILSTKPPSYKDCCWHQAVFPLNTKMAVKSGHEVEVNMIFKDSFKLETCMNLSACKNGSTEDHVTLKVAEKVVTFLNDRNLPGNSAEIAREIAVKTTKSRLKILDLTSNSLIGLHLMKIKDKSNLTIILEPEEEKTHVDLVSEIAARNSIPLKQIDCVSDLHQDRDLYDVVIVDPVDRCGKLNPEIIAKIPDVVKKLEGNAQVGISPAKISIFCQLFESEEILKNFFVPDNECVHGLDICSALNSLATEHQQDLDLSTYNCKIMSNPEKIHEIELNNMKEIKKEVKLKPLEDGVIHGLVYWFNMDYGKIKLSTFEPHGVHFKQAVITFNPSIEVKKGEDLNFTFCHQEDIVFFLNET